MIYNIRVFCILLIINIFFTPNLLTSGIKYGGTCANFLSLGQNIQGISMGEAQVAVSEGLSSVYWNPAALSFINNYELDFTYQPLNSNFSIYNSSLGINLNEFGNIFFAITHFRKRNSFETWSGSQLYSEDKNKANDYAYQFGYSRLFFSWLSLGGTVKHIQIHPNGKKSTINAFDYGAIINSNLLSPSGRKEDGLKIGISQSNYGDNFQYEQGLNDENLETSIEVPKFFRLGISVTPLILNQNKILCAFDVIHPNNEAEYFNLGIKYLSSQKQWGQYSFSLGYKDLLSSNSLYGISFGVGLSKNIMNNLIIKVGYAYVTQDNFNNNHNVGFSVLY